MDRFCTVLVVALIFAGTAAGQQIEWTSDLETAKTRAAEQNKQVLLHFSADWCRPCKHLETFVFTSSKVIEAVNLRVIPVHIDTDLHPELVKQYGVNQIPSDVVITPEGRVIQKRQSPKDSTNYVRMMKSLDKIGEGLNEERTAMAQRIDEILETGNAKTAKIVESNDFVAKSPEHSQPGPSPDSQQLKQQLKTRSQAKLVDHVSTVGSEFAAPRQKRQVSNQFQARGPQRVINDQFFMEKSEAEKESKATLKPASSDTGSFSTESQTRASIKEKSGEGKVVTGTLTPARSLSVQKPAGPPASQHFNQAMRGSGSMLQPTEPAARLTGEIEPLEQPEMPKIEFALGGKCPVTLIRDGKWVDGDPRFGCVHRGRTYLFTDKAKMTMYQRDPDSFSPLLAGYDPVLFHERGELVDGKEKHGVFMGKSPSQRIVLFDSAETRARFQKNPKQYMATVRLAIRQSDSLK